MTQLTLTDSSTECIKGLDDAGRHVFPDEGSRYSAIGVFFRIDPSHSFRRHRMAAYTLRAPTTATVTARTSTLRGNVQAGRGG